jgi:hypothetical protein
MRRTTAFALLTLLALLVLTACSSTDDASDASLADGEVHRSSSSAAPSRSGDVDVDEAAAEDAAEAPATDDAMSDGEVVRPAALLSGRRVVRTAEIQLTSDDPDRTADEVMRLADRVGGFVATTDLRRDDDDVLRGSITIRVPSEDLVEVLRDLEQLGASAPVTRIDERDVTTEASDLEARLTNLTSYEDELRALLSEVRQDTSSPDDLLRIFERIREVRAEIDTIEARLASLADQVSLATVHVGIEPSPAALPVTDPGWAPADTVREAFTAAARGLSRVADVAIWLTVGVLPVLLVVAAPLGVLLVVWRRLRPRAAATTEATPADAS